MRISLAEKAVLRELAAQVAERAAAPAQEERRRRVKALNRLASDSPNIYCFPEGAWLECIPAARLTCADPVARGWEMRLRMALYTADALGDDQPVDSVFNVPWDGYVGDWGLTSETTVKEDGERHPYFLHPYSNLSLASQSHLGAVQYQHPLQDWAQLETLRTPEVVVDRQSSAAWLDGAREIFGEHLAVRRRCAWWQTVGGVCQTATLLRGMDRLMMDMYDAPDRVHALMQRLSAGQLAVLDRLEAEGLLSLNNEAEWIHTGGIGYSDELPGTPVADGAVRCEHLWGGAQSQDLIGISPAMYSEFFFPYLKPIVERFGLGCYGCCEPLHEWLPQLSALRNLRRVSVSPWADLASCAEQLGDRVILSCKPNPTALSTERFDEAAIAAHLQTVFETARRHGCHLEVIMKDLHTVQHQPERLARWVALAREARDTVYGG